MRTFLFCLFLFSLSIQGITQQVANAYLFKTLPPITESTPEWAVMMYAENANVLEVDEAYKTYYSIHPFEKNTHTQNYKHWRRLIHHNHLISPSGQLAIPSVQVEKSKIRKYQEQRKKHAASSTILRNNTSAWTPLGPNEIFEAETTNPVSWNINIYVIDQSISNPDILYCGTETGAVFRSEDKGMNWVSVADELVLGGIGALKIDPSDPDIVYMGQGATIYKTTDGGDTWTESLVVAGLSPNEFLINASNSQEIFAACSGGLYHTTDGGTNWTQIFSETCWDINQKPNDDQVIYLLKNNPNKKITEFFRSVDGGQNFDLMQNGWYSPTPNQPNQSDGGAKMAVTPADPDRVYAVLLGNEVSYDHDVNWIGVYRSDDAGQSWFLPAGEPGGPYTNSHWCLSSFNPTFSWGGIYDQGFYNLAIAAAHDNADHLLVGCLNLFRSENGAASYTQWGGYGGGPGLQHPDIQDLLIRGDDVWVASDGGLNFYDADLNAHESRIRGINAAEYWGFDSGWNDDVLVGGRYHNGNAAWYETYPSQKYIRLGGAEAPTGFVYLGDNKKVYHSDITGYELPVEIDGTLKPIGNFSSFPNEAIANENRSEWVIDPTCYNHAYLGIDHQLWKTEDGGLSFEMIYEFGSSTSNSVTGIEISRVNPQVMYVVQRLSGVTNIHKTEDGGDSWNSLPLPASGSSAGGAFISLSAESDDDLVVLYGAGGNNPNKVFRTQDGGDTWTNYTTNTLDGHFPEAILYQGGTDGAIYLASNLSVFYRDDNSTDWELINEGLPAKFATNELMPFYRDGKLRSATYNRGIWETSFCTPSRPVAQPMVDKLLSSCLMDTFYFEDYSILKHDEASWEWSFPGATWVDSYTTRNPKVIYDTPGIYDVSLQVTDGEGESSSKTVLGMIEILEAPITCINSCSNAALNHPAAASSLEAPTLTADLAFDGDYGTRWASQYSDPQWISIDLESIREICGVKLYWEAAFGRDFTIEVSDDGVNWSVIETIEDNEDLVNEYTNLDATGRYVRMYGTERGTPWGYSLFEFEVYTGSDFTSVNEIADSEQLLIYPNPAHKAINITYTASESSNSQIKVYNANGQLTKTQAFLMQSGENTISMNIDDLKTGIYFLRLKNRMQKLIIVQ